MFHEVNISDSAENPLFRHFSPHKKKPTRVMSPFLGVRISLSSGFKV